MHALLRAAAQTVATAESLTGGRLAAALTAYRAPRRATSGGCVTYATSVKESLLGVPATLVERYGVISSRVRAGDGRRAAGR